MNGLMMILTRISVHFRWQGPVSMALYSPGDDFKPTIDSINYARKCLPQSELVRKFATFHIFFDANKHFPKIVSIFRNIMKQFKSFSKANYLKFFITSDFPCRFQNILKLLMRILIVIVQLLTPMSNPIIYTRTV